ncbi:MAG: hypothetical protein IIY44_02270 [Erysipelotrichales bacterium]|nr:hypothetical protein [Erysipelotrichales bacterium]
MKNNGWKTAWMLGIAVAVGCAVLWPLMDWIIAKFVTHGEFVYTPQTYIARPMMFGLIAGIVIGVTSASNQGRR